MTDKQIVDKLRNYADTFDVCIKNKDYAKAKYLFDTARNIAVFMELSKERMIELFGDRPDKDTIIDGAFKEALVQKAYKEVVVINKKREQ